MHLHSRMLNNLTLEVTNETLETQRHSLLGVTEQMNEKLKPQLNVVLQSAELLI